MAKEREESPARIALVTGAGSGIGRAVAALLACEGYCVALVGRTEAKLLETARQIESGGAAREALVVAADLAKEDEACGAADRVLDRWGRLDVLVNNAGWGWLKPIVETTPGFLRTTFEFNFFSAAHLILRAWPVFLRQKSGCVVNVSSGAAHDPFPGFFAYAASKAAMESLCRSIANEKGAEGIRAYSVAPGAVETPLLRSVFSEKEFPRSMTLDPLDVARRILDCIRGTAGVPNGGTVLVKSPG